MTARPAEAVAAAAPAPTDAGTLGGALTDAARRFAAAGIDGARLDARLLLAAAVGATPTAILSRPERRLAAAEATRFEALVRRRLAREPVALILGRREFWGLDFKVTPATLVPRPESETVVERALAHVDGRPGGRQAALSILDLGTGSGCLLLALLHELPNAAGLGVDVSPAAVTAAEENARRLGLAGRARFATGDWGKGVAGAFDLIVANPPYIADGEMATLMPEVRDFEPRHALAAGPDGLDAYRAMFRDLGSLLARDGVALIEIGWTQGESVAALARSVGLAVFAVHRDLAGRPRVVEAGRVFRENPEKKVGN